MVDSHFEQIAELKKELAAQAKQISSLAQSLYLATQNLDEVAGYVYLSLIHI